MLSWSTLIVIIIALWGVISQVIESAARKAKEKKRQEELALRASHELGVTAPKPAQSSTMFTMKPEEPEGGHPGHDSPTHGPSIMGTPTMPVQRSRQKQAKMGGGDADLAARRRAQLEQLRQRRGASIDSRQGTLSSRGSSPGQQQPPQPKSRTPFQQQPQRRPTPTPQQPRRVANQPQRPTAKPPKAKQVSYRSGRPLSSPPVAAGGAQARQTVEELVLAMQTKQKPADAYTMPTLTAGHGGAGSISDTSRKAHVSALQSLLSDPNSLRQIFLAKELLDAPVGLRENPEHGYLAG